MKIRETEMKGDKTMEFHSTLLRCINQRRTGFESHQHHWCVMARVPESIMSSLVLGKETDNNNDKYSNDFSSWRSKNATSYSRHFTFIFTSYTVSQAVLMTTDLHAIHMNIRPHSIMRKLGGFNAKG